MPLQDFDARSVQPQQPSGMGSHPAGMFDFQISNTFLKPSENNNHLMLHIEFTSPAGRHVERFIVDGNSPQAIDIANKQLSAICHVVGIFNITYPKNPDGTINMPEGGRSLRGARGKMDIGFQKGHEPTAEKPAGGYVEIKKYYDVNGNEPGKQGSAPQPVAAQQAPQGQPQGNGGWQQPANPAPSQSAQQPAWGGAPQQANPASQGGGWSPGPTANPAPNGNPPWGGK